MKPPQLWVTLNAIFFKSTWQGEFKFERQNQKVKLEGIENSYSHFIHIREINLLGQKKAGMPHLARLIYR